MAYLSCFAGRTHFAQTNADQRSFLFPQTDCGPCSLLFWPWIFTPVYLATDWLVPVIQTARTMLQNIVSVHIYPCLPGQCQRGRNIFPCNYSTWIQAAKLPVLTVYRVGFAQSCSNLIGQPFHKGRRILGIVGSVACASVQATCVHNTAELVSSSWFVQCVHCTLYSVYTV